MIWLMGAAVAALTLTHEAGPLSYYAPGDGHNAGTLACGGRFRDDQVHIAYRGWRRVKCGRAVLVYSEQTKRAVLATVRDAGPFGVVTGPLRRAKAEGRWMCWPRSKPPPGWRWRAKVDLSVGLWRKLGKPRFLSKVHLVFLPLRLPPQERKGQEGGREGPPGSSAPAC